MIGKVHMSKSIADSVTYVVQKPAARVLAADGIRTDSVPHMIRDFGLVSKLNPGLENKVGHISLSWSWQDRDKLSPEVMVARAREYMDKMGIRNTQYLIAEHRDTPHPHVHIVYNAVSYGGRRIEVDFQYQRSMRVISQMIDRHGYHLNTGKQAVSRERLNPSESARFALYDIIRLVLEQAKSWEELQTRLQRQGVSARFKQDSSTGQVLGISFRHGAYNFKGSTLDPGLSYGRISRQLEHNLRSRLQRMEERAARKRLSSYYRPSSLLNLPRTGKLQPEGLLLDKGAVLRAYRLSLQQPQAGWSPAERTKDLQRTTQQAYRRNLWKW